MAHADTILAAVQRIHEASLTPDGWTRALPSIAAATRSGPSLFLIRNALSGATESITGFELSPEHLAGCAAAASTRKLAWMEKMPAGIAIRNSAMLPDCEFIRTPMYNEVVRHMGVFYGLMVSPLRNRQNDVYLSVSRYLGQEDYRSEDVAVIQALTPHLATAVHVGRRLAATDLRLAGACVALDRLEFGVALVDAAYRILFANRFAEGLLAEADGLRTDKDGICIADASATRNLRRRIARIDEITLDDEETGAPIDVPRSNGRAPLRIVVASAGFEAVRLAGSWLGTIAPAAILIITDPEKEKRARRKDLRRRFGLTNAEADVALEMIKGDGRDAVATRLGISMTTVRTHLGHIFEKTGVRRQAELVRLLIDGDEYRY